jgi:plastocyanin
MMNVLDSRGLDRTNCFAQCFSQAGTHRYAVVPALGGHFSQELPFVVTVAGGPATGEGTQHNVEVRFKAGHFAAEPASISVQQGDVVLWTSPEENIPRYAVIGKNRAFASDRLTKECLYTHIFGLPGTYRWVDANGSQASGTVTVTSPDSRNEAELRKWRNALGEVALVTINGARSGNDAKAVVGQQVFFAVEEAPGISITDERVLRDERAGTPGTGAGPSGRPDLIGVVTGFTPTAFRPSEG